MIGGRDYDDIIQSTIDVYNIYEGTVQWNNKSRKAPYAWTHAGVTTSEQYFYIAGGSRIFNLTKQYRSVTRYDFRRDIWDEFPDLEIRRHKGPSVFIIDNQLYVLGGHPLKPIEIEVLNLTESAMVWNTMNVSFPYIVYDADAIVVNKTVYICGGQDTLSNTILSWSPAEMSWNQNLSRMKYKRTNLHCTVSDGQDSIWVIGPGHHQGEGFMEQYRISNDTWQVIDAMPQVDETYDLKHICLYWEGLIYITFRGPNHEIDDTFYVFNVTSHEWIRSGSKIQSKTKWPIASIYIDNTL